MNADRSRDPEQALERDAAELEQSVERLDEHIRQARSAATDRVAEAEGEGGLGDVAGDWEGEARSDDDPEGAAREG